jgi:hypothetical protein
MSKYPKSRNKFDLLFVIFGFWLTLGVFVDGWAHNHLASSLESFFTPWHAVFYSGFMAVALLLISEGIKNYRAGFKWPRLLPRQYHLSFIGLVIFFFAGIGDLVWHLVFGIEVNVEALLSPTHLLLALGGSIIMCGPFHALWHKDIKEQPSKIAVLLSVTFFLSLLTFMTQFAHPLHHPWMGRDFITNPADSGEAIGVASIIIQTGIFMGLVLTLLKKWHFPLGGFTLIIGLNAILMTTLRDQYRFIPGFIIAGILIDLCYMTLKPKVSNPRGVRIFATIAPILLYTAYTLTIFFTTGTWWSIHLWGGAIVIAGITGFLLSYLVIEPAQDEIKT